VGELMDAFYSAPPLGQYSQEHPDKLSVVEELEDVDDPRVFPFFLSIVSDEKEDDVARMAILNTLTRRDYSMDERLSVGRIVLRILKDDANTEVRNYAAMAMLPFIDLPGALDSVGNILLDPAERRSIRSAALAVLERRGPIQEVVAVVRALVSDPAYRKNAIRILNVWYAAGDPEA